MENVNMQAEVEVLGRIIRDPRLIYKVNAQLTGEEFYNEKHKTVFESMKACSRAGKPIEVGAMMEYLRGSEVDISFLVKLSSSVASTSDIQHYTEIVLENSRKRRLKNLLQAAIQKLDKDPFEGISSKIIQDIYKINEENSQSNFVNREELMEKVLDYIQAGIDSGGESVGMKTGWKSLDIPLKGFNKGDLVILGGRPSMGKTVFSLNLADKLSTKYKVLFMELEMTDIKLGLRELAAKSYIALNKLYEPHTLTEAEYSAMTSAVSRIAQKGNLTIDDKARAPLEYIRNRIHYLKNTTGLDLVFIDHLGIIKQSKGFSNRNDWIGEITANLKEMAKEFNVCVIALSQLSREVERRSDKRPELADLRDSGSIEQDADVVIFLYRDGYYHPVDPAPENESLEVLIAKNRDGKTGPVNMSINLRKQLVTEIY